MNFDNYFIKPGSRPIAPIKPVMTVNTSADAMELADKFGEYEQKMELFVQQMHEHMARVSEIHNRFKADAYAELGISENPKRETLYNIARKITCRYSHGYPDIFDLMETMKPLIMPEPPPER